MKRLFFLRHGKSDWNSADPTDDHGRTVAPRGRKAAQTMGRFLTAVDAVPDKVLTSSAVRARTTTELAAEAGGWSCPIEVCDDLYEPTPRAVLTRIHQQPDELESLLIVGHEPCWSAATGGLVGDADIRFPTAAVACIDANVERWRDVGWGCGMLLWHVPPKLIGALLPRES